MKIFSLRNMVGLAAIYGAARYAKNNGGVRQAVAGLVDKVRGAVSTKQDDRVGSAHDASIGPSYGASSSEGAGSSRDLGGSNRRS